MKIFSGIVNGTHTNQEQKIESDFLGYTVILTADLTFDVPDQAEESNFTPIGNGSTGFNGTFDGQGYTISNLSINITGSDYAYAGLFGYLDSGATVKNLKMINSEISATVENGSAYSGGIVGTNDGTIENCYNTGVVTAIVPTEYGEAFSGGIAGQNYEGTIENCYSTGNMTAIATAEFAQAYSGGIAGENYEGTIINCYNTGDKFNSETSGGITGLNYGVITNCSNAGIVTGSSSSGGIVGYNNFKGIIVNCYNTKDVIVNSTSSEYAGHSGGIAGYNSGKTIMNCYNIGYVTSETTSKDGSAYSGGIAGYNEETITNCYNTGTISSSGTNTSSGGIVGENYEAITNCYWLNNISNGVGEGTSIEPSSTFNDQGQVGDTSLHTLLNNWVNDNYRNDGVYYLPWTEDPYPEFEIRHPVKNDNEIYEIRTADDLILVNNDLNGSYILMDDINLSEFIEWAPIGSSALFNGTFDGNGYTISKMTITGDMKYAGLFGCIGNDGVVKNLGLVESSINISLSDSISEDISSGGIAGRSYGTIINCYNTGAVTTATDADNPYIYAYSGGIVGDNWGSITNCYNTGVVTANVTSTSDSTDRYAYSGGIVGDNWGSITNCYNTGVVTANATSTDDYASSGGIVGDNWGSISNCYNTGDVKAASINSTAHSGGIAGYNEETITNCYNSGAVTATSESGDAYSGGIAGENYEGTIINCYNAGAVTATSESNNTYLGGIVGKNWKTITNCYNIETVNSSGTSGGIAGNNSGTIENCYYLGTDDDFIEGTTNLSKDDMAGLKLLGGEGSNNNLNKEQASKPWSPDIFNVNGGYPILADVPTHIDPENSTNKIPQSAVYILSETEDTQTENYLELITSSVLSAKTIETVWNGSITDLKYNWYIYGNDKPQGSDATIDIAETDKLIVYYVTASYNIDGEEFKYTSLTRSVCNTQSTPPQPPPTPPPYDPTPTPTPDPEPKPIVPDENNNITVPPIDEEKTEELINEAVSSGSDSIPLIDTSNVEGEYTEVTVSKSDLETISKKIENNNNINSVSIETSEGDIILEKEVLNSILETTNADSISFEIEDAKDKLTEEQKEAVGDRPVYDINITAGNENITSFNGKTITISLPYTLKAGEDPENIVVYYVKEDGSLEKVNCTYKDGKVIFETDHLSKYFIGYEESDKPVTPDTPDDKKDDNNTIYYAVAAVIIILIIIALAYYFMKKKQ